jgi:hypothetical protein
MKSDVPAKYPSTILFIWVYFICLFVWCSSGGAMCMQVKCSTTELHPQLQVKFFKDIKILSQLRRAEKT